MEARRVEKEWERAGVYYIRTEAMVLGFGLPLQGEFADDTVDSSYILVLDGNQKPVSTNRIHPIPEKGYVKIERVATISTARHLGAGRMGIEAAEGWARELGYHKSVVTSREEAVGFYQKLGYSVRNDMNADTLEPKTDHDPVREDQDPRFICVYMEKEL